MKKQLLYLLSGICFIPSTLFTESIHSHQAPNKLLGENWKILGSRSFGAGSTGLTISTPGNYILSETVSNTASTTILNITANDVVLDLGGHTLNGSGSAGIGITIANSVQNITIQNGAIRATTGVGISGGTSLRNITLKNIAINNTGSANCISFSSGNGFALQDIVITCNGSSTGSGIVCSGACYAFTLTNFSISGLNGSGKHGINFANGCYGISIKNGKIAQVDGDTANTGINFASTCYDIFIEDISIANSGGAGIALNASYGIKIKNIMISNIGTYGITTAGSYNVTIDGFDISKSNHITDAGGGIQLSSSSDNIIIKNGVISNVSNDPGYGIIADGSEGLIINNVSIANTASSALSFINNACKNVLVNNFTASSCDTGINIAIASQDIFLENIAITNATAESIVIAGTTKGVKIKNALLSGGTDGISFTGAAEGISLENIEIYATGATGISVSDSVGNINAQNITISNATTDGISLAGANSYNLHFNNTSISKCANNGVNISQTCSDVSFNNFEISKTTYNGIAIAAPALGVTLKNGYINGIPTTYHPIKIESPVANFVIDTVACAYLGLGMLFSPGAQGGTLLDITVKNSTVIGATDEDTYGIKITDTNGVTLENCIISNINNTTQDSDIAGVLLSTCTNVNFSNVSSGGLNGDGSTGFTISAVNGGLFKNCSSKGNFAADTTSTYTCAGFYIKDSTACTFENCISSGHQAPREAAGFYSSNSKGIYYNTCESSRCSIINATGHAHAQFTGFYSKNGSGNSWKNCLSQNHFAGNTITSGGSGAAGFYLLSESQANFYNCTAQSNGSKSEHAANALGFYLDITASPTPIDCTYCQLTDCKALSNCTSATSGTTAYGFRDNATNTTNIILNCYASSNTDNATTHITTNYYMDLPIGGTTPENWPRVEATMDSIIELANKPLYYNVSITS